MKGLKKIALVAAIAAAPMASHAGMKALDDTSMGNVTGQAGVTIELETYVEIGKFTYTDEGTFAVNDIKLGGANASGLLDDPANAGQFIAVPGMATQSRTLDDLKIDIDVAADGDAMIHVGSITGAPIDWGMQAGSMSLNSADGTESTTLLSGLKGFGLLGALDIRVDTANVGGVADSGSLMLDVAFTVERMDFDVDFLGVGIRGMTIAGANAGGEVYTDAELEGLLNRDESGQSQQFRGNGAPTLAQLASGALGKSFAIASVDVYKGDGLGASTKTDVLRVDVKDVLMDVNIDQTIIGGTNIGTIGIDNLHVSDTRLAVYGKD